MCTGSPILPDPASDPRLGGDVVDLGLGELANRLRVAGGGVADHDVAALGVVPLVEVGGPSGAHEADGLAVLQGLHPVPVRVHHASAGGAVPDLHDPGVVDRAIGALGGDHGQGGHDDPVVEVQGGRVGGVLGRAGELRGGGGQELLEL